MSSPERSAAQIRAVRSFDAAGQLASPALFFLVPLHVEIRLEEGESRGG